MKRPVNLSLVTMKFPITAIISILHRVSGVVLFLFIPFVLCMLAHSLDSPDGFKWVSALFSGMAAKFFLWAFLSALFYHLVAGIKHLFMDIGFGETMCCAVIASYVVLFLGIAFAVLVGVWLWV